MFYKNKNYLKNMTFMSMIHDLNFQVKIVSLPILQYNKMYLFYYYLFYTFTTKFVSIARFFLNICIYYIEHFLDFNWYC